MSEEIRRKILEEAPWRQIGRINALLKKLVEEAKKEAVIGLLKLSIDELKEIVSGYGEEMEKKLEDRMKEDLGEIFEMMKERVNRLTALIEEHTEKLESFAFPTDDDKRIHEMYKTLPENLREERPFVMEMPNFDDLSPYPLDMRRTVLFSKMEEARRKIAEIGGFISLDQLEEKTGIPSQEIDEVLKKAGFLRQSKRLPNGRKMIAYKLPIDEIWLRKIRKKFEEEEKLEKERIEKRRKEELRQRREFQRY